MLTKCKYFGFCRTVGFEYYCNLVDGLGLVTIYFRI